MKWRDQFSVIHPVVIEREKRLPDDGLRRPELCQERVDSRIAHGNKDDVVRPVKRAELSPKFPIAHDPLFTHIAVTYGNIVRLKTTQNDSRTCIVTIIITKIANGHIIFSRIGTLYFPIPAPKRSEASMVKSFDSGVLIHASNVCAVRSRGETIGSFMPQSILSVGSFHTIFDSPFEFHVAEYL